MTQELNLTIWQGLAIVLLLLPLLWRLYRHTGHVALEYQAEEPSKAETTVDDYQARYGAYMQAQSKYYN